MRDRDLQREGDPGRGGDEEFSRSNQKTAQLSLPAMHASGEVRV